MPIPLHPPVIKATLQPGRAWGIEQKGPQHIGFEPSGGAFLLHIILGSYFVIATNPKALLHPSGPDLDSISRSQDIFVYRTGVGRQF